MLGIRESWAVVVATLAKVETNILRGDMDIKGLLLLVANILVYGLGVAAVIGVVWAGVLYLTARDSEAQITKAKTRLLEVAIGVVAWAVMFALLQWLIPGFSDLGF